MRDNKLQACINLKIVSKPTYRREPASTNFPMLTVKTKNVNTFIPKISFPVDFMLVIIKCMVPP